MRCAIAAAIVALAAAWTLAEPAAAKRLAPPDVPAAIAVDAETNKLFLVGHAVGVQIYTCTNAGWLFVAPRADLYGDNGKLIATHFAGPTWRARDGSQAVGARVDGVTVDPTAIAWLLLSAASTSTGDDGARLARTTFIQRVATTGGLAPPAADCNVSTVGKRREIAYTADYFFWRARGA